MDSTSSNWWPGEVERWLHEEDRYPTPRLPGAGTDRPRRRSRFLHRELEPKHLRRTRRGSGFRAGQPQPIRPRGASWDPLPGGGSAGQARPRHEGFGLRRGGRPPNEFTPLRRVARGHPVRGEQEASLGSTRLRSRLPRHLRQRGLPVQVHDVLLARTRPGDSVERPVDRDRLAPRGWTRTHPLPKDASAPLLPDAEVFK